MNLLSPLKFSLFKKLKVRVINKVFNTLIKSYIKKLLI